MVRTEVVEGDYKGYHINVFNNSIHLYHGWSSEDIILTKKDIKKIESIIGDIHKKHLSKSKNIKDTAWKFMIFGLLGGIFGALIGAIRKEAGFICYLKDGKQFIGICSQDDLKNIMALK